ERPAMVKRAARAPAASRWDTENLSSMSCFGFVARPTLAKSDGRGEGVTDDGKMCAPGRFPVRGRLLRGEVAKITGFVRSLKPGSDDLAQTVDRFAHAVALDVPERPAVAGFLALDQGANLVDRAGVRPGDERTVGPHGGAVPAAGAGQLGTGREQAGFQQRSERNARLGAFAA